MLPSIVARLAAELAVSEHQVVAAIGLFDEGATVPFVARYRKEVTGGLDDTQLRNLDSRLGYLRELESRREAVLASVIEQGKLTPELETLLRGAETRQRLEDLYLPYRPKRRTKAQIAVEAGLDVLAERLFADPALDPQVEAAAFLKPAFTTDEGDENPGVADATAALEGARAVLMERFAEDADLLGALRGRLEADGVLCARVVEGKEGEGAKFRDWFAHDEAVAKIPSHRALALLRGRNEGVLRFELLLPQEVDAKAAGTPQASPCEGMVAGHFGVRDEGRPGDRWLMEVVRFCWRVKLQWQLESELVTELRHRAEEEAIAVFGRNLEDLLLAAPAGAKTTLGLDPGIRTGVKVAVVDATGRVLDTATVYPFEPRRDRAGALRTLAELVRRHGIELVAIGNGTASRETEQLVGELQAELKGTRLDRIVVSEAGASVYSASELAAREFPELDVSLRGAVSIARRLQDPLAELVKIEPKAIGVGQYQHDVSQTRLARALEGVVEDCVNRVGVDLNTASAPLLARVAGVGPSVAATIVAQRDERGAFRSRAQLLEVPRLGPKTFEQAAGFLRVTGGDEPLDASAVHPEAYAVARRILEDLGQGARPGALAGKLGAIDAARYTDERFGLPTVQDIMKELEKPGRDPRPDFVTASFREGVETMKDLRPDMVLEGVVSNVTNFGAFVDIGVHQDGLVHISQLADRFVKDPRDVVRAGQVVKVRVVEVDLERKRIALTMRSPAAAGDERAEAKVGAAARADGGRPSGRGDGRGARRSGQGGQGAGAARAAPPRPEPAAGAMADALRRALDKG
ncbi:MAG TPA: Tex family protein [Pseudomonadales bacterium]|nr:Tex family protein [Pseudomonadales bacterium]